MQKAVIAKLTVKSTGAVARNPKDDKCSAIEFDTEIKILGKLCPQCGEVGAVLYQTTQRIIYECPNEHQYETRKSVG